jgi:hypothetical protein
MFFFPFYNVVKIVIIKDLAIIGYTKKKSQDISLKILLYYGYLAQLKVEIW